MVKVSTSNAADRLRVFLSRAHPLLSAGPRTALQQTLENESERFQQLLPEAEPMQKPLLEEALPLPTPTSIGRRAHGERVPPARFNGPAPEPTSSPPSDISHGASGDEASARPHRSSNDVYKLAVALGALRSPLRRARADGEFLRFWSVAGLKRNEVRNAAVVAWLLDPRGTHGHGDLVLREFVRRASQSLTGWPNILSELSSAHVRTEEAPLGSDRDRVDIAVEGESFVLFIEVKIDAHEGDNQLDRYLEAAEHKVRALRKEHALVIYLSPRRPTSQVKIATLTWRDLFAAIILAPKKGVNGAVVHQYAEHVRQFF